MKRYSAGVEGGEGAVAMKYRVPMPAVWPDEGGEAEEAVAVEAERPAELSVLCESCRAARGTASPIGSAASPRGGERAACGAGLCCGDCCGGGCGEARPGQWWIIHALVVIWASEGRREGSKERHASSSAMTAGERVQRLPS